MRNAAGFQKSYYRYYLGYYYSAGYFALDNLIQPKAVSSGTKG